MPTTNISTDHIGVIFDAKLVVFILQTKSGVQSVIFFFQQAGTYVRSSQEDAGSVVH